MRKLTKSRPLFFARRLAADSPRARSAAPRRRGRPRGRESTMPRRRRPTEFCPAESGRMGIGKEGGREGGKEKRERKERRSLALLLLRRRRRRRPTGKTIINHIGFDRRRERGTRCTGGGSMQHGMTRRPTDRRARWQQSCAARRSSRASLLRGRTYVLLRG